MALTSLGKHAPDAVQLYLELLSDEDLTTQGLAVYGLGAAAENTPVVAGRIATLVTEEPRMGEVGAMALRMLNATEQLPAVKGLLTHQGAEVRRAAVEAVGALTGDPSEVVQTLADLLSDEDADVRLAVAKSLGSLRQVAVEDIPVIVGHCYRQRSLTGEVRFLAHFVGGGRRDVEALLSWSGCPPPRPASGRDEQDDDIEYSLRLIRKLWSHSGVSEPMRRDFAGSCEPFGDEETRKCPSPGPPQMVPHRAGPNRLRGRSGRGEASDPPAGGVGVDVLG